MTVTITIEAPDAAGAREQMLNLIGGPLRVVPGVSGASSDKTTAESGAALAGAPTPVAELLQPTPQAANKTGKRGKARAVDAQPAPVAPTPPVEPTAPPQPEPGSDEYEDAKQDAADEAAETAKAEDAPLTLDDVRNAANGYIEKWGKPAAAQDLVPIVMEAGGVPNIGKLDPADQALLRKVKQAFLDAAKADTRYVKAA